MYTSDADEADSESEVSMIGVWFDDDEIIYLETFYKILKIF